MARAPRMTDAKNYMKRIKSSQSGNYTGAEMTEKSKMLIIEYNLNNGLFNTPENLAAYKEWKEKQNGTGN